MERNNGQAVWKCSRCEATGVLYLAIDSAATDVQAAVVAEHTKQSPDCDTRKRGVLSITSDLPNCQPTRRFATGGIVKR